ncbi:unnamed protein product [Nesidiocoris tenuis]|uniref:Uncharacterized protein n=1 Tax=Nesidiocoris tenuis TaxID=355587 RepID=A0A6H5GKY3_9HEMI|nr:unnamed protein product [Nesidiocoris tenuis]
MRHVRGLRPLRNGPRCPMINEIHGSVTSVGKTYLLKTHLFLYADRALSGFSASDVCGFSLEQTATRFSITSPLFRHATSWCRLGIAGFLK